MSRKTSKGIPRYRRRLATTESDTFLLSGAEDLVPVAEDGRDHPLPAANGRTLRPDRTPRDRRRPIIGRSAARTGWSVCTERRVSVAGRPGRHRQSGEPSRSLQLEAHEDGRSLRQHHSATSMKEIRATRADHHWDQLYLKRIRYADYTRAWRRSQPSRSSWSPSRSSMKSGPTRSPIIARDSRSAPAGAAPASRSAPTPTANAWSASIA